MQYKDFIELKQTVFIESGFHVELSKLNQHLFEFQRKLVQLALFKGRYCLWMNTGLGKSIMQLSWADEIQKHTNGIVIILAPLVVAQQTEREAVKFGIDCQYIRSEDAIKGSGIYVTNYEVLRKFENTQFDGVVLDESSIIKNFNGKIRTEIIDRFKDCQYKLACSATPAPNDYIEIGNHAEFMGVMSSTEMLAMFFTHDGGDTSKWRLKGHARRKFWDWVSGWAAMASHPEDLGYPDSKYTLPPLNQHSIILDKKIKPSNSDLLFSVNAATLQEQRTLQKELIEDKCIQAAKLVNNSSEQWIVWCYLNEESTKLKKLIPDAVEVKGSDALSHKENAIYDFITGNRRVIISKVSIMGFGINFQNCHKMVFVGMSHSFESVYQAVRRVWRFGQLSDVDVYFIYHHLEGNIIDNLNRKEEEFKDMGKYLIPATKLALNKQTKVTQDKAIYNPTIQMQLPTWLSTKY